MKRCFPHIPYSKLYHKMSSAAKANFLISLPKSKQWLFSGVKLLSDLWAEANQQNPLYGIVSPWVTFWGITSKSCHLLSKMRHAQCSVEPLENWAAQGGEESQGEGFERKSDCRTHLTDVLGGQMLIMSQRSAVATNMVLKSLNFIFQLMGNYQKWYFLKYHLWYFRIFTLAVEKGEWCCRGGDGSNVFKKHGRLTEL